MASSNRHCTEVILSPPPSDGTHAWMKLRRFGPWLFAWVALAAMTSVFLGRLNWIEYHRLARNSVRTDGRVLRKEPHWELCYTYVVQDRTYFGTGSATYSSPSFGALNPGDRIDVFYSASSPALACVSDPQRLYENETESILLAAVVLPAFVLIMLRVRYQRLFDPGRTRNGSTATRLKL
jgi:hypothetical protein